jgi:tetratricopeptide (TPR) repeat protein
VSTGADYDVFISYARADLEHAVALQALLEGPPYNKRVWRDKTELRPGEHVDEAIPRALRAAKAVVVLWSQTSVRSEWVRNEATYAYFAGKIATLSVPGFDYGTLPATYRPLNCGDLAALLQDPALLLDALARIAAARAPAPPKLIDTHQLPRTPNTFVARSAELAMLMRAWSEDEPNVVALIAAGGTGKTALANAFLDEMSEAGWGGTEAVYAFSFDSQGTDEKRQGSSDRFFFEALDFFGEDPTKFDSIRKRAHRLADILEQRRVLLILDGIEPMQSPRGDAEHGRLRDDAMSDFLRDLARDNAGLCVVTTRLPLPDLAGYKSEQVRQVRLKNLPLSDAVALLRTFKVDFPQADMERLATELGQVVSEEDGDRTVRCHAKAIALIGGYLQRRFPDTRFAPRLEEVRAAFAMPDDAFLGKTDSELKEEPGYAVYRMIRRYEILYEESARGMRKALAATAPGRQLVLLRIMGLFDRPAPWAAVLAVLAPPEIAGLTDGLGKVTSGEWREAVAALRQDGLVNPAPDGSAELGPGRLIDAHPLVREYFGRRLALASPEAFKAAHGRLYDHYRYQGLPAAFREPVAYALLSDQTATPEFGARRTIEAILKGGKHGVSAENTSRTLIEAAPARLREAAALIDGPDWKAALAGFLPDNEAAMAPLFAAIAHGAAAGRHDETFNEVYWARLARGNENYAAHKLGLYGAELAAIAHFFTAPFGTPAPGLLASRQALVLNLAGFRLRALGRLDEAVEPFRASLQMRIDQKVTESAARAACNLAELLITLGRLKDETASAELGAIATSAQAVATADASGDTFLRMVNRTVHADALAHAGQWATAAANFVEAEIFERELNPELPMFGSLRSYQLCELRLAQGRWPEVHDRGIYALEIAQHGTKDLLGIGLATLSIGRAAHLAALQADVDTLASGETGADGATPRSRPGRPETGAARHLLNRKSPPAGREAAVARIHEAVERLRHAGSSIHIPRGLISRAGMYRDFPDPIVGSDRLAADDLREAFDIAERGRMRLFLADAWIEQARQHLARSAPAAAEIAAARAALRKAASIVAETGYGRRVPDLALVTAELALTEGNADAARQSISQLVALMRAHDLWGFLPELQRLAARHGLDDLGPTFSDLRTQLAAFDAEADAAFEHARRRADGLDDHVLDTRLADPKFRARLDRALVASGYKPLDETPIEEQRRDARNYVQVLRKEAAESGKLDDLVIDIRLDDPAFRRALVKAMKNSDMPDLDTLPLDAQRDYARKYIRQVERKGDGEPSSERSDDGTSVDPAAIPDALVEQMLDDAAFRETLDDFLGKAGQGRLASMSREDQLEAARALIAALIQAKRREASDGDSRSSAAGADTAGVDPASIPDELVERMLADARFRKTLDEFHAEAGMPRLAEMSLEDQRNAARALLAVMVEAKARDGSDGDAPAPTPPAPSPPPAPRSSVVSRLWGRFTGRGSDE